MIKINSINFVAGTRYSYKENSKEGQHWLGNADPFFVVHI